MVKVTEHQIQAAIVDALVAAGFRVKHTTAYRQKGASGVSKGIPDLLVSHPHFPNCYLGIEVKTPTGKLSPEQKLAVTIGEYVIARSPIEAVRAAAEWLEAFSPDNAYAISRAQSTLRSLEASR